MLGWYGQIASGECTFKIQKKVCQESPMHSGLPCVQCDQHEHEEWTGHTGIGYKSKYRC